MQRNDTILERVISVYRFILDSALNGEIHQVKQIYTFYVYAPLYEWSRTPVEKVRANQQYKQFLLSMDEEQVKIHKASRMLIIIQKVHHLLVFGNPPVGFAFTESAISQDIVLQNKMSLEFLQLIK